MIFNVAPELAPDRLVGLLIYWDFHDITPSPRSADEGAGGENITSARPLCGGKCLGGVSGERTDLVRGLLLSTTSERSQHSVD